MGVRNGVHLSSIRVDLALLILAETERVAAAT